MIFFTSDTHYGHENIIKYCNRPFQNSKEMDDCMYSNWVATVNKNDVVYHLGDVCLGGKDKCERIVARLKNLPGKKYLIPGNHDEYLDILAGAFEILPPLYSKKAQLPEGNGKMTAIMCHYPLLSWHGIGRGSVMLHGHNHGRFPATTQRCDVCVDDWGFSPVSVTKIVEKLLRSPKHNTDE